MNSDNEFYFFSYSRNDSEFVLKLAKELRFTNANIWLDQLDIKGGDRWDSAIENALEKCVGMIIILSPESVNSANVLDEVSYGLEEGKLIIPIFYKECKIPFRLRRLQYIDFTVSYDEGLKNLLAALSIEKPPKQHDHADTGENNVEYINKSFEGALKEGSEVKQSIKDDPLKQDKADSEDLQSSTIKTPSNTFMATIDQSQRKNMIKWITAIGVSILFFILAFTMSDIFTGDIIDRLIQPLIIILIGLVISYKIWKHFS